MTSKKHKILSVTSPFDEEVVGEVGQSTEVEVLNMVKTARAVFEDKKKWLAPFERKAILLKLAELVEKEQAEFATLIAKEGGKPLTDAKIEVARAIEGIRLAVQEMANMKGEEIPMGLTAPSFDRMAFTFREPIGIVVAVSAFNHPLNLIVHQVIPAVAVGAPVIVKPASSTPLNCLKLVDLLYAAGLPRPWCQVAVCDSTIAEKLATHPDINFLSFIGSSEIGWTLQSKLAKGVRSALEHGGVAPVIVDDTVDFEAIIPPLLKGGFYHAGQVCVSVQKIFVPKSHVKQFAESFAEKAALLKVGDPLLAETEVGPLIARKEVTRVDEWVMEATLAGGACLVGGKKLSQTTYAPTVLLNPPNTVRLSQQEVFGPVVCIYGYDSLEKAVKQANSLPYAFQAAVFSKNLNVAIKLVKALEATAVMVNDHTAFRVDWMPFGGRKHSGLGLGGIGYSMKEMTHEKMMVINHGFD